MINEIMKNVRYEIETDIRENADGWYKLKDGLGLYRGKIDPLTGRLQDQHGELRLEYGEDENRKSVSYKGNIEDGLMQGEGQMAWPCGTIYIGEFKDGYRHGKGILIMPDGLIIEKKYCKGAELDIW